MERRLGEVEWSPSEQSVRAEDFQVITLISPSSSKFKQAGLALNSSEFKKHLPIKSG